MLQLIAHFRLLCMLEVDGSFAKTPGHAQAELAGIVPVENPMQIEPLCRSSKTDPWNCGEMIKRTAAA